MRYHTQLLTIAGDGTGRWTLKRIGTAEERMDMEVRVESAKGVAEQVDETVKEKVREVKGWKDRVERKSEEERRAPGWECAAFDW